MSKQTINIGASPNDGTGTPLRTSFDYTNQNFTELYTALGGGVGLPGATTQVIFNDGGTNLAGDAGLVYNKTTDALTVAGLVTAGSASITGDLTVDTNVLKVDTLNNRVGIGTATPTSDLDVFRASGTGITSGISLRTTAGGAGDGSFIKWLSGGTGEKVAQIDGVLNGTDLGYLSFQCGNGADAMAEQYRIASSGVFNWYDGAGGTRMTLNSTGLGIGMTPTDNLSVGSATYASVGVKIDSITQSSLIFRGTPDASGYEHAKIVSGRESPPSTYGSFLAFYTEAKPSGNTDTSVERARFNSTGNLAFANGKGIDFSAVTGGTGTATANVLNDYEEGTFTPAVIGSTIAGVGIYNNQIGRYTKVGNLVTIQVYLDWTGFTVLATGDMRFGNFPFSTSSDVSVLSAAALGYVNNITLTAGNILTAFASASTTYVTAYQTPTGGGASNVVPIDTAGVVVFTLTYRV